MPGKRGGAAIAIAAVLLVGNAAWAAPLDTAVWQQASPASSPSVREGSAVAYDGTRHQVVLVGGRDAGARPGIPAYVETWLWDGTTWTEPMPTNAPTAERHAMAFDTKRGKTVLFGGLYDGVVASQETWEWDGTAWAQKTPSPLPAARYDAAMAFDDARGKIVLFGGTSDGAGAPLADTWEWDGTSWTQPTVATSPPGAALGAMAYDAARAETVLLAPVTGGVETWEWNGASWTKRGAGPGPARLAYDAARKRTVAVLATGATYEWDGSAWTARTSSSSPPGAGPLAFDAAHGRVVLFYENAGGSTPATWLFHARGAACGGGTECDTGQCVDGVCCESPSCAACQSCSAATPGTCTTVTSAPDPDTCSGTKSCDATGACKIANGAACTAAGDCASGFCVDGVCCDSACTGVCHACSAATKQSGQGDGVCDVAKSGANPHGDCAAKPGTTCAMGGACDGAGACKACLEATCDGDHTVHASTGTTIDCTPYTCAGSSCKTACGSVSDCVAPYVCDESHHCIAASGAGPDGGAGPAADAGASSGGCAVGDGNGAGLAASAIAVMAAIAAGRRRRGARRAR